jgi:hypothetical protein
LAARHASRYISAWIVKSHLIISSAISCIQFRNL